VDGIDRVGRAQHALITWQQLQEQGMSASSIARLVERGYVVRVHHGVYRVAGAPITWEQRQLAAVLAAGPDAAASHRASSYLWRSWDGEPSIEISVPRRQALTLDGVIVHRTRDPMLVHRRFGIPTTTPMRMLADLGSVAPATMVEVVLDRAEAARLVTIAAVEWELARLARRGRRGVGALREVLDRRALLETPPDGVLEPRFARLCKQAGLPMPVFQHPVGRFEVDFAYPDLWIAIEVDGYGPHSSPSAFQRDRHRQNDLVVRGWLVLRFTWADVVRRPERVAQQIAEAIGQRQSAIAL
jgi:hypothetical protein